MGGIGIVIVTHNSGREIGRCLDAALCAGAEVVVVDNASADDTIAEIKRRPAARLIANPANRGFAAATNQGFIVLNQPYILRLDYLTATSLQYRFFDANMNQLCSRTRTLTGLPNMLYIALATQYADGVFDDVTIGGNAFAPEPHSFGLLALFGSMSTRLRRRRSPLTVSTPLCW